MARQIRKIAIIENITGDLINLKFLQFFLLENTSHIFLHQNLRHHHFIFRLSGIKILLIITPVNYCA